MKILVIGELVNEWGQELQQVEKQYPQAEVLVSAIDLSETNALDPVLEQVEADSIVLVQSSSLREEMVRSLKEKGVQVILCTPTKLDQPEHDAAEKVKLRKIAEKLEVPMYDVNRYAAFLYQEALTEGTADTFHERAGQEIARFVTIRLREYLQTEPHFKKHYYGACMYPEVWSKEVFEHDVAHMTEIGMNFARFGEFAWKHIEPQEGKFDLTVFEEALQTYQKYNIDVCLCIPTPTPPRWFTEKFPEARIKNIDGTVMEHGSRQHVCTNNPEFRYYANRMTREVARVAEKYPNVIAIQLDNEFKCHVDLCYCDVCRSRWHEYVQEEYQTIEAVNAKWGTQVWSEHYDTFGSIVLPTKTPFLHNSSLMNAFRKFTADTLNEFAHDLCHFIRMETAVPITHNTAFGFNLMNDRLFSELDVAGFDTYAPSSNYPAFTMNVDRWRNVKKTSEEVMLLETSTSHAGHIENYIAPSPAGWITAELFIGFAGNLKTFTYWHYRNHRFGVEQPHSGVVTAWGEPDIGYEDVLKSGQLTKQMQPILAESKYQRAKIAFLYSDHAKRFYNVENGGVYDHRTLVTDYYGTLTRNGMNVEMIHESSDYDAYEVLIVPFVRWISPTVLEKFQEFVNRGGKLILGPMTGDRTEELSWPERNGLDILGEWLGLNQVKQFTGAGNGLYKEISEPIDRMVTTFNYPTGWESLVKDEKGATLAAKGKVGAGEVIYVGGLPTEITDSKLWQEFLRAEVLPYESDREYVRLRNGLKKYTRTADGALHIYIANMTNESVDYDLYQEATELLTGETVSASTVTLAPYEYQILSFNK